MPARWIDRTNRWAVHRHRLKNGNEAAGPKIVRNKEFRQPRDAVSGKRRIAQRLGIGCAEATANRDRAHLSVNSKPPFDRSSAMDKRQTAVTAKFINVARYSVTLQIGR